MKTTRFTVPARFAAGEGTFVAYLGNPAAGFHPLHFQAAWLWETRGGSIDAKILATLASRRREDRS